MMRENKLLFGGWGGEISRVGGATLFKAASHPENPIVKPWDHGAVWIEDGQDKIGAIFNGGAERFNGKVVMAPRFHVNYVRLHRLDKEMGVVRYYMENYVSEIHIFESEDGVRFRDTGTIIRGDGSEHKDFTYGIEDVRIVRIGEGYMLIGCGKVKPPFKGRNADRIAIYTTSDFNEIVYRGIIREIDSRNAVIVPEPIDEKYYLFIRLHPDIQVIKLRHGLDQLLNPRKYGEEWRRVVLEKDRLTIMRAGEFPHESEKIGAGPQPIKTKEGWLLIYHAVGRINGDVAKAYGLDSPVPRGYSISAALLDINDPRKVLWRAMHPIYVPSHAWEMEGSSEYPVDVPWVVFPTGAVRFGDMLAIYAGAGDKYMVVLTLSIEKLLSYLENYGRRGG